MNSRLSFLSAGGLLQTAGLVGFVWASQSAERGLAVPSLFFGIGFGLAYLLHRMTLRLRTASALGNIVALGALAVIAQQVLGFLIFPGLVKDIELLSLEHLRLTLMVFFTVEICYLAGYLLMKAIDRMIRTFAGTS